MQVIERANWSEHPALWKGEIQGKLHGSDISLIFNYQQQPGGGPRLHQHPHDVRLVIRDRGA